GSDGLRQIVVRSQEQTRDTVARLRPVSRDEDDGKRLTADLAEAATNLVPARTLEPDLDDDDGHPFLLDHGECLAPGCRLADPASLRREDASHECAERPVAVCDQDDVP